MGLLSNLEDSNSFKDLHLSLDLGFGGFGQGARGGEFSLAFFEATFCGLQLERGGKFLGREGWVSFFKTEIFNFKTGVFEVGIRVGWRDSEES